MFRSADRFAVARKTARCGGALRPSCLLQPTPPLPPGFWVQSLQAHFFIVSGLASLEKPSGSKYPRGAQSPMRPPTLACTVTLLDAGRSTTLFGAKDVTLRKRGAHVRRRNQLLRSPSPLRSSLQQRFEGRAHAERAQASI